MREPDKNAKRGRGAKRLLGRFVPRLAPALLFLLVTPASHAAVVSPCQPGDSEFLCRMRSVLTLLDVAAGILAVILTVAILAAVRAYRRKPRKLAPEDLTPDAK